VPQPIFRSPPTRSWPVDAVHIDERDPADALLDAAGTSDLLVLGARGLQGLRALGSVSERVAHRAPTSVLVVRPNRYRSDPPTETTS
jgi:nucleotide-binding universal stress UspA family protein